MNIRIAMIGASGSGKTSFMSGLYHHFINKREENGGFGFNPLSDEGSLSAVAEFSKIASVVEDGEFPPGSLNSMNYRFNFMLDNQDICNFDWMDYRGGSLEEAISDPDSAPIDYQEVREAIDDSMAVAVFIDALQLVEYENDIKSKKYSGIALANKFISILGMDYQGGKDLVFVFILTKADGSLIGEAWRNNSFELLKNKAERLLRPALDVIYKNKWKCGIVATGVVGVGRVRTEISNKKNESRTNFNNFIEDQEPEPFGQNSAMFYMLGSVLININKINQSQESRIKYEIDDLLKRTKKFDNFWKKISGKLSNEQIVELRINEINKLKAALVIHEGVINKMFKKSIDDVKILMPW